LLRPRLHIAFRLKGAAGTARDPRRSGQHLRRRQGRGRARAVLCSREPFCCCGASTERDRRRLWQLFASRFRLLLLAGPHDVGTPGSDRTAFQDLLRASLNGGVQTSSDPETVFNRAYQIGDREGHEYILGSMGDVYRVEQNRMQGNIDGVFIEDETVQFKGWALEPCRTQRAQMIAVFLDDHYLGYGATGEQRPDVVDKLAVRSALYAGFNFHFKRNAIPNVGGKPRVFVLSNDGTAAELTSARAEPIDQRAQVLRQRLEAAGERIRQLETQRDAEREAAGERIRQLETQLDAEREAAGERIRQLETQRDAERNAVLSSTSWRITAPLRWMVNRVRRFKF
jgi:hypothetical protein